MLFSFFSKSRKPRHRIIEQLSNDTSAKVRHALLLNPQLPKTVRMQLEEDVEARDYDPYETIIDNPPEELDEFLYKHCKQELAEQPDTPLSALMRLSEDDDNYTAGLAVQHPSMPIEKLYEFARNPDLAIFVVSHPRCPVQLLEKFSRHSDGNLRSTLAEHLDTPSTILSRLANAYESSVRAGVAENPACPSALLLTLANDDDEYVRKAVAKNKQTPPATLTQLSKDAVYDVCEGVADNPATLLATLLAMFERLDTLASQQDNEEEYNSWDIEDDDDNTWQEQEDSAEDDVFYPHQALGLMSHIAANPTIPLTQLQTWAKRNTIELCCGIARNPNASLSLLMSLLTKYQSSYDNSGLLYSIAANPIANNEILSLLSDSEESSIRTAIASHAQASPEVLALLAQDEDEDVRIEVVKNTQTPADTLLILSGDVNERVRWHVAAHSNTPDEALQQLANDEDDDVRANVAKYIRLEA